MDRKDTSAEEHMKISLQQIKQMWTQIMDVMWRLKQKEEFFMVRDLEIRQKFEFPMHEATCSLHILYFYTYLALLLMSCPLHLQNCFMYVCITGFMYVPPS